MQKPRFKSILAGISLLAFSGFLFIHAHDDQRHAAHPDCSYFGKLRD